MQYKKVKKKDKLKMHTNSKLIGTTGTQPQENPLFSRR